MELLVEYQPIKALYEYANKVEFSCMFCASTYGAPNMLLGEKLPCGFCLTLHSSFYFAQGTQSHCSA